MDVFKKALQVSVLAFFYLVPALLLAALGLVLTLGRTSGIEDDASLVREREVLVIYRKGIAAPGALQFEFLQSVSTSERSIYHTQAGFKLTEAE